MRHAIPKFAADRFFCGCGVVARSCIVPSKFCGKEPDRLRRDLEHRGTDQQQKSGADVVNKRCGNNRAENAP